MAEIVPSGGGPPERPNESNAPETWWKRNHTYVWWCVVALTSGVAGMLGILTFAGMAILPPAPSWWTIRVPVLDKTAHGDVVTAAVSWFAGTIALYTFYINVSQKERHNLALEKRERDLAQELRDQTKRFEDAREKRERDLAELQRIEAEFTALADDFAQDAPLARINAAIGMGELAKRPDPRREENGTVMPDPRTGTVTWTAADKKLLEEPRPWPDAWRSLKTERNYPYFLRAAHRLAAALYMWEEEASRSQVVRVLREMGEWAKDEGTDEPLLHALCNALAEANRTAWSLLRDWAAVCLAPGTDKNRLAALLGLLPPEEDDPRWNQARDAFLADLLHGLDNAPGAVAFLAVSETEKKSKGELENRFHYAGKGWTASRDSLATALRQLSQPPDVPNPLPDTNDMRGNKVLLDLPLRRGLDLQRVRCFGASLGRSHLEGALCYRAHFEGADCFSVRFEGAVCAMAHFQQAHCLGALFNAADCTVAHFDGANCSWAHFDGANCSWAHFEGAVCPEAHFEGANCTRAHFEGADCTSAHFDAETRMAWAEMGQTEGTKSVRGMGPSWEQADFRNAAGNKYDTDLWNFLNKRFPREDGQPRTPPWKQEDPPAATEPS